MKPLSVPELKFLFLAPVALLLGMKLAAHLEAAQLPGMCWRHGWVVGVCERCEVWQTPPYTRDLTRADRAESAAIRRMEQGAKID